MHRCLSPHPRTLRLHASNVPILVNPHVTLLFVPSSSTTTPCIKNKQGTSVKAHCINILKRIWRDVENSGSWEDPWTNTAQQRQPEPAEEFELHDDHEFLNAARNRESDHNVKYEDGNTIGVLSSLLFSDDGLSIFRWKTG